MRTMWTSRRTAAALVALLASSSALASGGTVPDLDVQAAARFAKLALDCVHQEYPNKIGHTMSSDADAKPPRALTPAFYGCYDWHSSVHGHWMLARLARHFPDAPFSPGARAALGRSLTPENVAGEVVYLQGPGRASFERPYGLAWLLMLAAELRAWDDPDARRWATTLRPLETEAAQRLASWLPKLRYPIRTGEHGQTAFAFGLAWDWSIAADDAALQALLRDRAKVFYLADRSCPLGYEPSGEDFLSPCLAEADFVRRILPPARFARWLSRFLPGIPTSRSARWLAPAIVTDRSDPRLAHIDGLNLSRAWMLEGIARGLPPSDARVATLRRTALTHREAALPAVTGEHYEGGHWLGTFAVYLTTSGGSSTRGDERR